MLTIQSNIEGKSAFYGQIRDPFEQAGFNICGGWEYDHAYFDSILDQHEGVTMYLRLPMQVVEGKLDEPDAYIKFGKPFVVKHVVHTGFVTDDYGTEPSIPASTGLNQFQPPLDPDDRIEQSAKWRQIGEQALGKIEPYLIHA